MDITPGANRTRRNTLVGTIISHLPHFSGCESPRREAAASNTTSLLLLREIGAELTAVRRVPERRARRTARHNIARRQAYSCFPPPANVKLDFTEAKQGAADHTSTLMPTIPYHRS